LTEDPNITADLKERLLTQMSLMVMCRHAKGNVLEKTHQIDKAISEYKIGFKMAQTHFGNSHNLVEML
jgi:hypothetical protein